MSETDFEVLTQDGTLCNTSDDASITVVEFERIIRAQLTHHVQVCGIGLFGTYIPCSNPLACYSDSPNSDSSQKNFKS